jgi:hypothetical protein
MLTDIVTRLSSFTAIGLDALNAKAAMLERLDNKYIITDEQVGTAIDALSQAFDILEIDARRVFTYVTRYFDDTDLRTYHDHQQGRRKRFKVRVRTYVDAGFSYLEVKLKDKRGATIKKRLRMSDPDGDLDETSAMFVEQCYSDLYGESFGRPLTPVLGMEYQRIALIAKEGGERLTIDTQIGFRAADRSCDVPPQRAIVETKSARGNGVADRIFRELHLHPTRACSKYCVGMASLGLVDRRNRFLPALRRLRIAEPAGGLTPETAGTERQSIAA